MRDILKNFSGVRQVAEDAWAARCPAHDDQRASMRISISTDEKWLLHCHAGCTLDAILAAARLEKRDLFPAPESSPDRIVATYPYTDEAGALLFEVVRFSPKTFRPRRPDGTWSLQGVRRVPYRLHELAGKKTVFVVEGEKDADRLWSLLLPATTNAGGAGKWRPEFAGLLKTAGCRQVVVLPDNDPAGETHGRTVARSCADVGLDVKLIALPGLPVKGDVSDFLAQHTKEEFLAIVRDAPLFNPSQRVVAAPAMALTSLADLIAEPDDAIDWLVYERIPAGSVVLFSAPPKAGKSTLARELGFCVACGEPFLGWRTSFGTVWFLIFEDKRSEVRKHFQRLGATGTEPIRLFIDQAPGDLWPQLQALAEQERPALIVVDILARALKLRDFNDYGATTEAFSPLLRLSRTTGATLLLLHHGSSHASREGLDSVLGSTAISGSVDNILGLKRTDQVRVLWSVQRIGPDLEPTVITLNPDTGRLEAAGSKRDYDDDELGERMLAALRHEVNPISERRLQEIVEGRNGDKVRVLRRLLGMARVCRFGEGGQRDPFRYVIAKSGSHDLASRSNESKTREPQIEPVIAGLFPGSATSVPEVPIYSWEQENKNVVRSTSSLRSSDHEPPTSVPEVPKVPEVPGQTENPTYLSPGMRKPNGKYEANSGSHEVDLERF